MLNKDEELEYKALLACIKQYYGCYPTGLMFKQIQRFHDNNKWSYKNIRLCLQYINDFTDIEFDKKYFKNPKTLFAIFSKKLSKYD